jgi:circadian clock protein KaiB
MVEPTAPKKQTGGVISGGPHYRLKLYVSGATPRSMQAVSNVRQLGEQRLKGHYELEVVDAFQQPELAREAGVTVLPTLVKYLPAPIRKLFGTLGDEDQILIGLGLDIDQVSNLGEPEKSADGDD